MIEVFKSCNCKNLKFYENQNSKSAQMDFDNETEADNFISMFDGSFGKRRIKLQKIIN